MGKPASGFHKDCIIKALEVICFKQFILTFVNDEKGNDHCGQDLETEVYTITVFKS